MSQCDAARVEIDEKFRTMFPDLVGETYYYGVCWLSFREGLLDANYIFVAKANRADLTLGATKVYCSHPMNMLI